VSTPWPPQMHLGFWLDDQPLFDKCACSPFLQENRWPANPALAYSTEYCINVAIDNKVKYGLLIKSIKHLRLLKDSWIRNSLWKNVWLGELLPFFKKCLVFIQSTSVVTKHVGEKNLLWGSPIGFSGSGISLIWSSGFGILKKIRGRDRDWNYAREVGYQK